MKDYAKEGLNVKNFIPKWVTEWRKNKWMNKRLKQWPIKGIQDERLKKLIIKKIKDWTKE